MIRSGFALVGALIVATAVSACGSDESKATAELKDRKGVSFGTVTFTQATDTDPVTVAINIAPTGTSTFATAGVHGMHIHAIGVCDAAVNFTSAMGHFDPTTMNHGNPASAPHHGGDFGNVTIDASSKGTLTLQKADLSLAAGAANNPVGHAVIFHQNMDDLTSQPVGNAGGRYACGLVVAN